MNSKSILMGAGTALTVILVVLGAFLNAIHAEAVRTELYDTDSRAAVARMHGGDPVRDAAAVEAYIGMNAEEQHRFAETVAKYMRGTGETLPEQLNEKEQIHFADVRNLIQLARRVSSIFVGAAVLLTGSTAAGQWPWARHWDWFCWHFSACGRRHTLKRHFTGCMSWSFPMICG